MWLNKVNQERKEYWDKNFTHKEYEPLQVKKGKKYMKLIDGTSVWGFVYVGRSSQRFSRL